MWQHHAIVLAVLAALAVPVYLLDHSLLRSRGDIFLIDLSGLLLTSYVVWLAVHVVVSSLALYLLDTQKLYTLHGFAAVASAALALLGFVVVGHVDSAQSKARYEARRAVRGGLVDTITLEQWWYVPDPVKPEAIGAVVVVRHSGRFAASVAGRTAEPDGRSVYHGEMRPQQQVEAGERIEYEFPLRYYGEEPAPEVEFSFMLFRDSAGSAPEDVVKTYLSAPERADDGERFYAALPPPVVPPSGAAGSATGR